MTPVVVFAVLTFAAYLIGSIPFGYLIGRVKGVNLFREGSGNIGATNAGRVLGRKVGIFVFALDFLKGALPVACIVPLAELLAPDSTHACGGPDIWRVAAAVAAFLGHLFPVYLGFRGGKGVATGAGTVLVLMPGPTAVALLTWLAVVLAARFVSVASLAAVIALSVSRCVSVREPFSDAQLAVTLYCLLGTLLVIVKHRSNLVRLRTGTEVPNIRDNRKDGLLRMIHMLAVGSWFGGSLFNILTAVPVFDSFKDVVANSPSDRTAYIPIVPQGTTVQQRSDLSSALAGAAVGPGFPRLFALAGIGSWLTFLTALGWRREAGGLNRWRIRLAFAAMLLVAVGWPVSLYVTELRVWRFHPDAETAALAKAAFGPWHFASLLLAALTTLLSGVMLAMAAGLKERTITNPPVAAA